MKIKSGNYIAGNEIWDYEELRDWVCNENYTLVDGGDVAKFQQTMSLLRSDETDPKSIGA